jgi:phosphoribosylamine--glycine ligase
MLNVLVIGSGGREHAIVRALKRSPQVAKIWCAPGNAGIREDAECIDIQADNQLELLAFAKKRKVDLTMVGPEGPLVDGLVDRFRVENLRIVGPTKTAARLEGSKSFAKEFMHKYGLPTARYEVIPNLQKGAYQLQHWPGRSVVKADGLAAGKGVKVCETQAEAKDFLYELMEKEIFGSAGATVLIEECLEGEEATILAFCDGKTLVPMPASQDHKRLSDGDLGPNTGGMGAYAPAPVVTPELLQVIEKTVFQPFLKGLQAEGFDYRGIIYFGLMLTKTGPQLLEFNVRFGDPETQALLPLLDSDFAAILKAVADQTLTSELVIWKNASSLCVVLASGGYPGPFEKGKAIKGLTAKVSDNVEVSHAGTSLAGATVVTNGGRVLGVTAVAPRLTDARDQAYAAVSEITWEGMTYRKDIGGRALTPAASASRGGTA